MNNDISNEELFELSINEAKLLAQKFRATKESPEVEEDCLTHIPPSLLSAEHIVEYVKETGLVAPFSADASKAGRLKKASYEARLGKNAYLFEVAGNDPKPVQRNQANNLVLPPNSIVFVDCDLQFRLPTFIALRFNLSISHVHRGLLLGTGPLVDPGFWGNLCIPIHNLTDEPYEIEDGDGLIWIEFTKTTTSSKIGKRPSGDGKWNIRDFIVRATEQVDKTKDRVGIRSGISQALTDAKSANISITAAKDAAIKSSEEAALARARVETSVKSSFFWGTTGVLFTVVTVVAAFFTLTAMYYSDMNDQYDQLRPSIKKLETQFDEHVERVDIAGQSENEARASISTLADMVTGLGQNLADLTKQLESERISRQKLEVRLLVSEERRNRLLKKVVQMKTEFCSAQTDGAISDFCSKLATEPGD